MEEPQKSPEKDKHGWRYLIMALVLVWTGMSIQFYFARPQSYELQGVVQDPLGQARPDVRLMFLDKMQTTDKNGRFTFTYPQRRAKGLLVVDASGFQAEHYWIDLDKATPGPMEIKLAYLNFSRQK